MENLRGEGPDLVGVDHVGSDNDWVYSPSDSFERVNERRWLGLFSGGKSGSLLRRIRLKVESGGRKSPVNFLRVIRVSILQH